MKARFMTTGIIAGFLVLFLSGCGGSGPGSPGSTGSEETGADLIIVGVNHNDAGFGDQGDNWDIDFFQDTCDEGPPPEFEPFGNDFASFTFRATPIDEDFTPGNLHIETFVVEFFPQDPGGPPIERLEGFASFTIVPDGTDIESGNFLIIDVGRKVKVYTDIVDGFFTPQRIPVIYDIRVTLEGRDDFDNPFRLVFQRTINIANFDNC